MTEPTSTDALIGLLVAQAPAVRRLRPPIQRAGLFLAAVAVLIAVAVANLADMGDVKHRLSDPVRAIELLGTLLTGCGAVVAACYLSVPGRATAWAWLPAPGLLLWIGASGAQCFAQVSAHTASLWALGDGGHCFKFILGVGIPISAALAWFLAHAKPIAPLPVALAGGLGAAGLAAFVLCFIHPFDATILDLGAHAAAVGVLVALWAARARWLLSR